jgi:hypothetical protein
MRNEEKNDYRISLDVLCRMAKQANFLAKQLSGEARLMAYRIKAEACSCLILQGDATVNGLWPNGILALDLGGNPPSRIHVLRAHLSREARFVVTRQTVGTAAVVRMSDYRAISLPGFADSNKKLADRSGVPRSTMPALRRPDGPAPRRTA